MRCPHRSAQPHDCPRCEADRLRDIAAVFDREADECDRQLAVGLAAVWPGTWGAPPALDAALARYWRRAAARSRERAVEYRAEANRLLTNPQRKEPR